MIKNALKRSARTAVLKFREATWQRREFPDFIIIGAQKSGTTSLYSYLSQHPQVLPSFKKELHFFDGGLDPGVDNFEKGESWYRAQFPWRKKGDTRHKAFEASPLYIFNPWASQRIASLIPKVKIIALLRNPTERAISHYFHEARKGREALPISEALRGEEQRLARAVEASDYKSHDYIHYSYQRRGLYRDQLERYFQCFSREQMLVMPSEMFFSEPVACLRKVFEFIGVDPDWKVTNLAPRNVANNRSKVGLEIYEELDRFFAPHNQELYRMVGEDYGW